MATNVTVNAGQGSTQVTVITGEGSTSYKVEAGSRGPAGTNGTNGTNGAAGPNSVTTSTSSNLTGFIAADGTNVSGATAGATAATANTLTLRDATGGSNFAAVGASSVTSSGVISTTGSFGSISTIGGSAGISTEGNGATITTSGSSAHIQTTGGEAFIATSGVYAQIYTTGDYAPITTSGVDAFISTSGTNAYIQSRSTFRLSNGSYTTTLSHSPTANRAIAFPNKDGTVAMVDAETHTGAHAFSSTTRPTSAGTGTPEATSLITRADGDARFSQVAGSNTFGGIQTLAIPGPYADDTEAAIAGVPDDYLYFQSSGAVVANVDRVSLDLQFATDKSLTARKGPTPVFTRASTATFIGSNGLIQSAAINAARFDHNPITLACKGLLIEESRTNLVFPSDTLTTQTRTVTAVSHTLSFYGTGTIVLSGAHIATVIGTGAYPTRTTLTFTPTAGSLTLTVTGSVTQAQLEAGAVVTSYIPTTTASVVRSADVCSITGSDFTGMYNATEGSTYVESIPAVINGTATALSLSNGLSTERWLTRFLTSEQAVITSAGTESTLDALNPVAGTSYKIATAAKLNDFAMSINGLAVVTDASQPMPVVNRLGIGTSLGSSGAVGGTVTIASIRYFKKRLPNAKLQTITT